MGLQFKKIGIILIYLSATPFITFGQRRFGQSDSYDPVPLTPFNGLKIQRSRSTTSHERPNSIGNSSFYDYNNNNNDNNNNEVDIDSGKIYYPFEITSYRANQGREGRVNSDFNRGGRPYFLLNDPINPTTESALFRSKLPENQRQPSTYQAAATPHPSSQFPQQRPSPYIYSRNGGVEVGRGGGGGAGGVRGRTFGAESLPPNYYFITPKESSTPATTFQLPPPPNFDRPPPKSSSLAGMRRIPDALRRTQYYPDPNKPLLATPYRSSDASNAPLVDSSQITSYNDYDTTFHSFYAPQFKNYIPITRYHHDAHPTNGDYNVEYETGNGIYQKESGHIKKVRTYNANTRQYEDQDINVKTGTVSWTSPEGIPFTFSYIADENGFRPIGSHIPSDGSSSSGSGSGVIYGSSSNNNRNYDPVISSNPLHHSVQKRS